MNFRLTKKTRITKGFTLVELIVVITILAILATIGFLALSGYSQDAKDSAIKANVRSLQTAISSEAAITNNSPRYYVVHDADYALSWAFAYVDGASVALTGWDVGSAPADSNYTAGKPDFKKLKLNPDKFRISASGLPGGTLGVISRTTGFGADSVEAAYDANSLMAAGADFMTAGANGKKRVTSYVQTAGVSPATKLASVMGDFPTSNVPAGNVSGLFRAEPGSATNLTGALLDGLAANGSSSQSCPTNYVAISGTCVPNSCAAIKSAYPSSINGINSIDPDWAGWIAAFNVYCDMNTNGGGWTLVFSANDGTRFNANTDSWSTNSSSSYTLTLAKKGAISNVSSDTLIAFGGDKFVWSGKKLPFTATTTYEQICGTTTSDSLDGATNKCFGWSPVGILYGWVFWVTNTNGFDHHNTTNWNMLNASCGNHYVYEHNYSGGSGYKNGTCNDTTKSTTRLSYFMR